MIDLMHYPELKSKYKVMSVPVSYTHLLLNNIGNILYVVVALAGGLLLAVKAPNLSISGLPMGISIAVPFLNMTKQFAGNINPVSYTHLIPCLVGHFNRLQSF